MAIAFDTSSIGTLANPATGITKSHTVTGSDAILFAAGGIPTSDKLTSATFDGDAMTKIEAFQIGDARGCYLLYIVVGTGSGTPLNVVLNGTSDAWQVGIASYTGADQTTPIDVSTRNNGTGSQTYTDDLTTTVDGCYIVGSYRAGTNLIDFNDTDVLQSANGLSIFDDRSATTAGTITVEMRQSGGTGAGGWVLAAFKPATAGAANSVKSINGISNV